MRRARRRRHERSRAGDDDDGGARFSLITAGVEDAFPACCIGVCACGGKCVSDPTRGEFAASVRARADGHASAAPRAAVGNLTNPQAFIAGSRRCSLRCPRRQLTSASSKRRSTCSERTTGRPWRRKPSRRCCAGRAIRRRAAGDESRSLRASGAERLARGLGWFSISLGLAEMLAPRLHLETPRRRPAHTRTSSAFTACASSSAALMIFGQGSQPAAAVWSRVAGDAVDIATLAAAASSPRTNRSGVAFATASVLGAPRSTSTARASSRATSAVRAASG